MLYLVYTSAFVVLAAPSRSFVLHFIWNNDCEDAPRIHCEDALFHFTDLISSFSKEKAPLYYRGHTYLLTRLPSPALRGWQALSYSCLRARCGFRLRTFDNLQIPRSMVVRMTAQNMNKVFLVFIYSYSS
jgi:hypothetical protein